jgi:hypothetical protein
MSEVIDTHAADLDAMPIGETLIRAAQVEMITAAQGLESAARSGCPRRLSAALARMADCYRQRGLADVAEGYQQQALYWAQPAAVSSEVSRLLRHLTDIAVAQAVMDMQVGASVPAPLEELLRRFKLP